MSFGDRFDQLKSAERQGNGTKALSTDGTGATSNYPILYDAFGKAIGRQPRGLSNVVQMADAVASFTENNLAGFNGNGEIKDLGIPWSTLSTGGSVGSYNVAIELVGTPPATSTQAYLALFTFTETVNFAGNFAGSQGKVGTNPTTAQTWTVNKNGSSVGTIAISTGGAVTFTTTSGATVQFLTGDELTLVGASSADATLANVSLTLQGIRATATAAPIAVVAAYYIGSPTASLIVGMYTFTSTVTFSGNFAGAQGKIVGTNPASTATFTIKKNGSSVGSAAISTGGVFTFTSTSGAAVTFNAGDEMTVVAPGTPDASLATFSMSFPASVSSSSGTSILLKTNGTNNGSQTTLNLVAGTNITLTDSGSGDVTIAAASGLTNPMTTAGDIIVGGSSGTPTRLAAGSTSGYVLTSNGAGVAPSYQASAGGSGSIQYGTRASLPATIPASGTHYICTDSPYSYVSNGSAWLAFFMGIPVTEPVTANYTWYNQSTATLVTTYGGEQIVLGSSSTGGFVSRGKTYPAVAFTQTFGFLLHGTGSCGLHIRSSSALMDWRCGGDGALTIGWDAWTAPNTPSGGSVIQSPSALIPFWGTLLYLRFQDNGTNRILSWSADGRNFTPWRTESRTASITPTVIGYGAQGTNGAIWCVHDSVTTP